ncbi:DnaJ-domain-containing protein [Exidia glandulosa HHB12029]|uniref:DnaJ-domain-containing protein n=1 Tax=Exidia glandulosa HHB12029 TaxID=1314781 RepID=A0A165N8U2_EXIGL|nr:DnaJ-domain-containing protein [Exidia glandulosa HHB12029]
MRIYPASTRSYAVLQTQDHYAVLGLSKFRYKATEEQIRIAHRKKVLKHHPDKKANTGDSNNDAFFKCIQKALEILTHPEKRRQYDSVDNYYVQMEDEVPSQSDIRKESDFFKLFGPIFEREARFSRKQPVPLLGAVDDSKEAVEGFYDFWYNFDSWRSFEYLDKEVNEGSESRDDKRYTEKKNKTERARRKKEDTARVRTLVDKALALDPRIARIKREEKAAREAKKKGKAGAPNGAAGGQTQKQKEEEERRKAEEEAKKKEDEEKVRPFCVRIRVLDLDLTCIPFFPPNIGKGRREKGQGCSRQRSEEGAQGRACGRRGRSGLDHNCDCSTIVVCTDACMYLHYTSPSLDQRERRMCLQMYMPGNKGKERNDTKALEEHTPKRNYPRTRSSV